MNKVWLEYRFLGIVSWGLGGCTAQSVQRDWGKLQVCYEMHFPIWGHVKIITMNTQK